MVKILIELMIKKVDKHLEVPFLPILPPLEKQGRGIQNNHLFPVLKAEPAD